MPRHWRELMEVGKVSRMEEELVPMPLYKYVRPETAINILSGSIRFTQPGAFNDPFELLPQFITPTEIDGATCQLQVGCVGSRRKGISRTHKSHDSQYSSDLQARMIISSLNSAVGILCLSKNPESLLMWGHYADEYRGAIIEFDDKHDFFQGLIPLQYKKKRPVYDIEDFLGKPFPIADLCVKPNDWAYEREVRIVRPLSECTEVAKDNNGNAVMVGSIPLECIVGVTMGERMKVEYQRKIWNLIKGTKASLQLAAVSNWEYTFRMEPIKFKGNLIGTPMISARTAHIFTDDSGEFGDVARWLVEKHPSSAFVNTSC